MASDVREIMLELKNEGAVFRLFSEEEIDRICSYFSLFTFFGGEIVLKPGEALDLLGVVVSGEFILEEKTALKGNWIVLSNMKRGSIIAHPSIFDSGSPPVRVTTVRDAAGLGTDGAAFERMLEEHPLIGIKFLKEIIRVLFIRYRGLAARLTDVF